MSLFSFESNASYPASTLFRPLCRLCGEIASKNISFQSGILRYQARAASSIIRHLRRRRITTEQSFGQVCSLHFSFLLPGSTARLARFYLQYLLLFSFGRLHQLLFLAKTSRLFFSPRCYPHSSYPSAQF